MGEEIKGYKVFNPDWTCMGFQYEVGKVFEEDVTPSCCNRGFHFCLKASDCFNYYNFNHENKVAEVVAMGAVDYADNDTKCCTNRLRIVREIPWQEVLKIVNEGKDCTGLCNTGNCNTGNWNAGNRNAGDRNTGNRNAGNCNTGDWNTGDRNTGCFMTEEQNILLFNKMSDWKYNDWLYSNARNLLNQIPKNVVEWIRLENMTEEEKEEYPECETTGGYLKILDEAECGQLWWDGLHTGQREIIKAIPNFDPDIFEQCTGIKIREEIREND